MGVAFIHYPTHFNCVGVAFYSRAQQMCLTEILHSYAVVSMMWSLSLYHIVLLEITIFILYTRTQQGHLPDHKLPTAVLRQPRPSPDCSFSEGSFKPPGGSEAVFGQGTNIFLERCTKHTAC